MDLRSVVLSSAIVVFVTACAAPKSPATIGNTQVVTVTTDGAETVVEQNASVWGGPATLVEEASIGVEAGESAYLFGNVVGAGATESQIFVLDSQTFRVSVFDFDGDHLRDFGNVGEGPGEFRVPRGLAVGQDRIFVWDTRLGRITVFDILGEVMDTWLIPPYFSSRPMVIMTSGELYVPYRGGMAPWGPQRQAGDLLAYPEEVDVRPPRVSAIRADGAEFAREVPFSPLPVYAMSPTGAIIYGAGDAYRFVVKRHDGVEIRIERGAEAVPVLRAEADWHRARVVEFLRQAEAGWQWDGPEISSTKPAIQAFVPAVSGEIWVVRQGEGFEDDTCDADIPTQSPPSTCWKEKRLIDAFAVDGRYLGPIQAPDDLRVEPRPYIRDGLVIGVVEDDSGTTMVKRFRLEPPRGE